MREYEDWADWAGDHPEQAEADLRAEREKAEASFARVIRAGLLQSAAGQTVSLGDFTQYVACDDEHEFHLGECLICEAEDEDYEPSDAQIPGTYEIGKAAA